MSEAEEKFIEELNKEHEIILGFQEYEKQIADLEAKLAESEEQKETLRISQSSTHETLMQLNDELLKTQKQLSEKEKEIETLNHYNDRLAQGIYHSYGEHFVSKIRQDKISFCIEQLEKVKANILSNITFGIESVGIMNSIDNQIDELKKGDEVV